MMKQNKQYLKPLIIFSLLIRSDDETKQNNKQTILETFNHFFPFNSFRNVKSPRLVVHPHPSR